MSDYIKNLTNKSTEVSSDISIEHLPIASIKPDSNQIRKDFNEDSLQDLAGSIKEHGVQNPIHVFITGESEYTILTGERRFRASQIVGLDQIPCIIHEGEISEESKNVLQLIENLQREDLSALETARGFQTLNKKGMSQTRIARELSISETTVSRGLTILKKLPEEWLKEIEKKCPDASLYDLYLVAKEKTKTKRANAYNKLVEDTELKIEEEEEETKKKKSTVKHEYSQAQLEDVWEIIKRKIRSDKNELVKLLSAKKIEKLLEESGRE